MKKFIITCQLPSGAKYAWSRKDGEFALVPINGETVRMVSTWDSHDDAEGYLLAQMEVAPNLNKLGPFKIEHGFDITAALPPKKED